MKKFKKTGVIEIGTDKRNLDGATFWAKSVLINVEDYELEIEIWHEVFQGSITNPHNRTAVFNMADLPQAMQNRINKVVEDLEEEILALPQYTGATEV